MTDFPTPRGFVEAMAKIRSSGKPIRLYFDLSTKRCHALDSWPNRPLKVAEVGRYDPFALGDQLATVIRRDLKELLAGRSKGKFRPPSPTYSATHARRWRRTHPLTPEQRRRMNTRSHSHIALKRGQISKHPCAICCSPTSQMHHPSYEYPLHVVWLCRKCHMRLHRIGVHWREPWNNADDVPQETQCTEDGCAHHESRTYENFSGTAGRRSP